MMIDIASKMRESFINNGYCNPFAERRKHGRPSLVQLIMEDFADCWNEDQRPRIKTGLLSAIFNIKDYKNILPSSKKPIKIKFIQRGTSN